MNVQEQIKNIKAECKPITNIDNFIRRALNKAQKRIQTMGPIGGWHFLHQYNYALAISSGVKEYGLSPLVDTSKIINFWDESNENYIHAMSRQNFLMNRVVVTSSGNPLRHMHKGFWPVQKQPPANSTITIVSDDITDSLNVKIQYLNSDGILLSENLAINGTTPVSTAAAATKIMSLFKDAKSSGIITVTEDLTSVELVKISPNTQSMNCPVVEFDYIPSSSGTLYYDFSMRLPEINDDDDISLLPEQYHEAMELSAKSLVYKSLGKMQDSQLCEQEFLAFVENMKQDVYIPKGIASPKEFRATTNSFPSWYRNPVVG